MASSTKRIMSLEALTSGRITHASQDGSREFISLLACICADGTALPPALIYKGDSGTLRDTWLEDWKVDNEAFFAVSPKGWSSDVIGLNWLTMIFQRYTVQKAKNKRRLLLVDGHSSHVNMKFINTCDQLRILLLILPPHSTHRLQPLDVSLFAPLASYYTTNLNHLLSNSLGMVSMTKRAFWSIFLPAWKQAFTLKNITSGFRKTGVFPYNPSLIIDKITKPITIEASTTIRTPMSCQAVRCVHQAYKFKPSPTKLLKILLANERLAAERAISQHIIKGLIEAFQNEKKRRKRGIRLNIAGEEGSGSIFFSPSKIQAAREFQLVKEEEEITRKQKVEEWKAQALIRKAEKEEERIQKKLRVEKARATKAAKRQAQLELKEMIKKERMEEV